MKDVLVDRLSTNQMFLNDGLENLRRAGVIPHAVEIDDGDRPSGADSKAIRFGAVDAVRAKEKAAMTASAGSACY
jgi:hypothetical protein